jgi:hypothetical protein
MSVEPSWVVLGAVILGGLIGLFQIPVWQGWVTVGIFLGRLLMTWGQDLAVDGAESLSALVTFLLQGGVTAEDPGALLAELRELPSSVASDDGESRFILGLFSLPVTLMYLLGRWRNRDKPTAWGPFSIYSMPLRRRLASAGLGATNGYLIARFLLPLLAPEAGTGAQVPADEVIRLMDENVALVAIGFVLILIVLGLQASGRARGESNG